MNERGLARRPGPLLDMVERARAAGWRIALDDVGAVWSSLSLLPFLRPDVIKLDLRLVQERTTVQAAEVVNAVAVQAAGPGALVLAEGIETEARADLARVMGAQLGQGYLLGRHVRVGDLLVRQGGDEYLVVLAGLPLAPEAARAGGAGRRRQAPGRAAPAVPAGELPPELHTTASVGISLWPHSSRQGLQMLDQADAALTR